MSAIDPLREPQPPREDLPASVRAMVEVWQAAALVAGDIAHAKRSMYLAYVAEGFTEAQALELARHL
jgi:hypothetical protein